MREPMSFERGSLKRVFTDFCADFSLEGMAWICIAEGGGCVEAQTYEVNITVGSLNSIWKGLQ